jgi:DNA polymerase II large subunit
MDNSEYFKTLSKSFYEEYEIATRARSKGFDPKDKVEILPAPDLASRVEGLIGISGLAELIRKRSSGQSRSKLAFEVSEEICTNPKFDSYDSIKRIETAVRVGSAILTEGVLVAPTEGIQKITAYKNQDNTDYIAVVYAGPIRGAGGTAAALSVALADYARKLMHIGAYKPTQEEIERCVEETELYHTRAARLQYRPTDDDIRVIVGNCPVCIDGVPTETIELSVHNNLERIGRDGKSVPLTNKVRGGVPLVLCEGIAQKAKKVLKETKAVGLDWSWLNGAIRVDVKKRDENVEKTAVFLEELVAGRPVLAYPGKKGGFRLRYGRSRFTGIASKGVSPATMVITNSFMAIGTQLKIELPGKGCVVVPVDSIEGPFVKLKSGEALRINDADTALKLKDQVEEIICLGDLLVTYGDFRKSNTRLQQSSYVEEFWEAQLNSKKVQKIDHEALNFEEAYKISIENKIPIHPKFLFEFQMVNVNDLLNLRSELASYISNMYGQSLFSIESIELKNIPEIKRVLELIMVPHNVRNDKLIIKKDFSQSLLSSLGLSKDGALCASVEPAESNDTLDLINKLSSFQVMRRSTFIGARVGRPEKAKERLMKPAPNVLFPIGITSKDRNISKAFALASRKFKPSVNIDIARYRCSSCNRVIDTGYCYDCQKSAIIEKKCETCNKIYQEDICPICNIHTIGYEPRNIDIIKIVSNSLKRIQLNKVPDNIKGVKGLSSRNKAIEPLEKGMLRTIHNVFIFKDGTSRFDATDVPITHFYPMELGISIDKLRGLGYTSDYKGNALVSDEQLVELKHQDVILSRRGAEYLLNTARFVDDMLERLYGLDRFYNALSASDMIGKHVITLSPHTSCGVLNRIIGFADINVGLAHPYTISARRRNCDGDEDTTMLLLDALINFSREFLPISVGGTMDTPLILTVNVMPEEVDDEVHAMEVVEKYPLEFYEKTMAYPSPSDVELELVENRLKTDDAFHDIMFTHGSSARAIKDSPRRSSYTQFKTMQEKVDAEFKLMDSIYSIDKSDAARKLIISHFIPDLIGNLHSFSKQMFRCSTCNAKYRRVPLSGKCTKDNGKLLLTISKGGIEKYLDMAINLAERYDLDPYIRQRLNLIKDEISALFIGKETNDKGKEYTGQFSLSSYI